MRFGVCALLNEKNISDVKNAGYDYIEPALNVLPKIDETELKKLKLLLDENNIAAETYNCFFSGGIALIGENVDYKKISDYCEEVFRKAAFLGGKIAVLGSGGARNIPDGFDKKLAEEQFIKILDICGEIAEKYGMKVVVEPLNSQETNFINTVAECKDIVCRCGNPNVGALADYYHIYMSGESVDALFDEELPLFHAHLARADKDRCMPHLGRDDESILRFAQALRLRGYDSRLSLEGNFEENFAEDISKTKLLIDKYFV